MYDLADTSEKKGVLPFSVYQEKMSMTAENEIGTITIIDSYVNSNF